MTYVKICRVDLFYYTKVVFAFFLIRIPPSTAEKFWSKGGRGGEGEGGI
jgi:hypothetical protein